MLYANAKKIADRVRAELAPHCDRCEIAGSIRRKKSEIGDIEIVAIPKPYDVGLFASGIAKVAENWHLIKGELGPKCRYTQWLLPGDGMKLDLFFATPRNWGLIFLIRTGPALYSKDFVGKFLPDRGYKSIDGMLWYGSLQVPTREEEEVFQLAGIKFVKPEHRI